MESICTFTPVQEEHSYMPERKFQALGERLPAGVVIYSAEGEMVYTNSEASRILGLGPHEIIEKIPAHPLMHAIWEDGSPVHGDQHPVMVSLQSGQPVCGKVLGIHPVRRAYAENHPETQHSKHVRWLLINAEPLHDPMDAAVSKVVVSFLDITALQQTGNGMREGMANDMHYLDLFNHIQSGAAVYEAVDGGDDFILKDINLAAEKINGITREKAIGKRISHIFPAVRKFGLLDVLRRVWQTGEPEKHPVSLHSDTHIAGWRENHVYRLPTGEVVAICEDISASLCADQALKDNEEKFQRLIDTANEGVWIIDACAVTTYVNPKMAQMLGSRPDEMIGRPITAFIFEEDKDNFWRDLDSRRQGVKGCYERRYLCRNGAIRWMLVSATPMLDAAGVYIGSFGMYADITDRLQLEKSLRETSAYLENLFDHANAPILVLDTQQRITRLNRAFENITGFSSAALLGRPISALFPAGSFSAMGSGGQPAERGATLRGDFGSVELPICCADGGTRILLWNSAEICHPGTNTVMATIVQGQDITPRKRVEEELRRSQEKYRALVENINEVIFTLDQNCHITYLSPVFEHLTGFQPDAWLGKSFAQLTAFDPRAFNPHDAPLSCAYPSGIPAQVRQSGGSEESQVFCIQAADGSARYLSWSLRPVFALGTPQGNAALTGYTGVFFDMTEKIRIENALVVSQNLADIGTLTSGIIHEIKSPLQIITASSERMLGRLQRGEVDIERIKRQLGDINSSAWHVANVTGALLNYTMCAERTYGVARKSQPAQRGGENVEIDLFDLNQVICDTLLLIEHQLSTWSNIHIQVNLSPGELLMRCDSNKITQVLINLLTNARDAMPNGGEIHIRTRVQPCSARNTASERKQQVILEVSDSGIGMPTDVQARLFEVFFTTKPQSVGSGLGLFIVRKIVQAHGGVIDFSSLPGEGTTFTISFPAWKEF